MFTGVIEKTGTVHKLESASGKRTAVLELKAPALSKSLKKGGSLAVNGACVTVYEEKAGRVSFHLVQETIKRPN